MVERKALQLPAPVYSRLAALAEIEHRSIAAQALHLIEPAISQRERKLAAPESTEPEGANHG